MSELKKDRDGGTREEMNYEFGWKLAQMVTRRMCHHCGLRFNGTAKLVNRFCCNFGHYDGGVFMDGGFRILRK